MSIRELERKRKELLNQLESLESDINKLKQKEDPTRERLNNLFEGFAAAQQENIDFDNRLKDFVNNKLTK